MLFIFTFLLLFTSALYSADNMDINEIFFMDVNNILGNPLEPIDLSCTPKRFDSGDESERESSDEESDNDIRHSA